MTRLCNCPKSLASAVELDCRKNQLAEQSCKTCGGRFVVDGIGPVSPGMLGTVGLEVANSVTPELSWKRVTKGRRSRKPVARNVNEFAKLGYRSPKRVGDFSVSDSEKFDDSTGCHFPEKGDHIPIKKRRRLLQSPSLPHSSSVSHKESLSAQPRTPSPHTDHWHSDSYTKQQIKGFGGSAAVKFRDNVGRVDDDSIPDVTDRKLFNPDDFSGIALLAAAACIDEMDDLTKNDEKEPLVEELLPEKSSALDAPNPSSRCNTCIELENPVQKEVVEEEDIVQCSSADNSITLSQTLHVNDEGGTARRPVSPKVDRRHWDLNTVMDAWVQPFDDSVGASLNDVSGHSIEGEKLGKGVCEALKKSEDNQYDAKNCVPPKETVENESGILSAPDRDSSKEISITKLDECPAETINDCHANAENSNQVVSNISSNLSSPLPKSHEVLCVSVDEVMMPAASGTTSVTQEDTKKFGEFLSSDNLKVVPDNNALPELFSERLTLKSISCGVAEVSGKISDLPENSTSLTEIVSTVITNTQDHENSGSNSYAVDQSQSSPKCEDLFASGVSTLTEPQEHVDPKEPAPKCDDHCLLNEGAKTSSSLLGSSKKDDGSQSDGPTSGSAKIGSSLEECHNSDISQDDRSTTVVSKEMTGLQAGYDSPYEDGEVRVSMLCPWEENEIDDGENECADYESDAREGIDSDGADYPGSEVVEAGSEGSQGIDNRCVVVREGSISDFSKVGSLKSSLRTHYRKDDIKKVENGGTKVSTCRSGPAFGQFVHNNDSLGRGYTSDRMGLVDMNGSRLEEGGSRATRGKLQSHIEGPSTLDLSERKDTGFLSQSRSRVHSRPGRQISPDKFMGRQRSNFHLRGGNGGDEQWGYWDSRNRFPSSYHGPGGQGYTRTRNIIADSADKFGGLTSRDHRQATNYSSKGIHRALARRSTFDRDDYYSIHRRIPVARDITTNRSRAGSGNYLQGIGRDLREDLREALADHRATSSVRMPHYLSCRERSFSPSSGRVPLNSVPRRKSRSRSRSRSPHPWHSRREGNHGIRRHSRSPDLRSEARVERLRMPHQKLSFPIDYSGSTMSPARCRSSPQRNYRWVEDHDYVEDDSARNRRSPGRMFGWGQRFDSVGSGRLKSDDYFRHTIRPGRFPPRRGTGRGGRKLDDNNDERCREVRKEIMHRARHSDGAGAVNRFRHDAEDNFEDDVQNNTDQRDVSRSSREGKRSFKVQG